MALVNECINVASGVTTFSNWASALDLEGKYIEINGDVRYECAYCGDYALYYRNKKGGYDAFLLEGQVTRTDSMVNHEYNRSFDNQTSEFEKGRYISEISTTYTCNTGWLTDRQSANLAENLIQSTYVFMHDLNSGDIFPVIIDETSVKIKTYRSERKLVNYQFKVKASQSRIRR